MASNRIPRAYGPLVSLATDALDGATTSGGVVGLAQHTAAKIRTDLVALIGDPAAQPPVAGAQSAFDAAKSARLAASAAARSVESNARRLVANAVDVLKPTLGRQWNGAWAVVGFDGGSLAIPDDPVPVLAKLAAYFAAHPTAQNAALGLTAAGVQAQSAAVGTARGALNQAETGLANAKQARDAAQARLAARLSGLLAELGSLLGADDPRWYAFGLERPADGEQPSAIKGLVLTAGGPGIVLADWDDARRADRYRVVWQPAEGGAPTVVTTTLHDSEITLTGLPGGTDVRVTVAAINDAGEGPAAQATVRVG